MAKVLLINPSKWGRGITPIWIPSHAATLSGSDHTVKLFDATFYKHWTVDEVAYNTGNQQYKPTDYHSQIHFTENDILEDLKNTISDFNPDIIFWSALSSHIHGEGEYVNIQYGYELLKDFDLGDTLLVTAGLQPTASAQTVFQNLPKINYLIKGESEFILTQMATALDANEPIEDLRGLAFLSEGGNLVNRPPQKIISDMDTIPFYDYSLFEDQIFLRPYNGRVIKAIDYELSRGCIYACEYCVETVIQRYYGFNEVSKVGTILGAKNYLRNKSAKRVFDEISYLNKTLQIELFRCQDTNFLSIDRKMLVELAELIADSDLDIMLYIETRPEGINESTIELLKKLKVDGVGMGIELSSESFREDKLMRFSNTNKILKAFKLLREAGIKRTAYNIIGLPEQDEESIKETIHFNAVLDPDNVTVAFYSPYLGTGQQEKAASINYFEDYEYHVDGQLRTLTKHDVLDPDTLEYYKSNFNRLIREKTQELSGDE